MNKVSNEEVDCGSVTIEIDEVDKDNCENQKIEDFRDGIFSLQTRRFGTVAELVIVEKYKLSEETETQHHDATDSEGNRVEIKFSKVLRSNKDKITKDNILEQAVYSAIHHRAVSDDEYNDVKFDSNIQQVKADQFDILYYGLYFQNKIAVFKVNNTDVKSIKGYSDFQHKGNEGEGQFHLNNDTISYHLENHFVEWLTYKEVYEMFDKPKDVEQ